MDKDRIKKLDDFGAEFRALCDRYQYARVACVIGFPCAEHAGEHLDLCSLGDSDMVALVDNAILKSTADSHAPDSGVEKRTVN